MKLLKAVKLASIVAFTLTSSTFATIAKAEVLERACYTSQPGCIPAVQAGYGRTGFAANLYGSGGRVNVYSVNAVDNWMRVNVVPIGGNSGWGIFVNIKPVANTGQCYTVDFSGNNSPVRSKPCNGSINQKWSRDYVGSGAYAIRSLAGNGQQCLNVPNANLRNGGYLFTYQCTNFGNSPSTDIEQFWFLRNI
jgi:hypothetical protein